MHYEQKLSVKAVRFALSVLAGSALITGLAQAQEAKPADQAQKPVTVEKTEKIQKIEVTGSNIKRVDTETASPVQVITRADIEKSGATSLSAVIHNIAANNTGALSGVEYNGFSPGATTASLRGLGSGATLVLVNGRRIAQYGITGFQSQFANLDSIPVSVVDHIDVLLDGASAIYGSEAIAGVINISLRSDFTGAEIKGGLGMTQTGKNSSHLVNATVGKGDILEDHFNIFGTYEHSDVDALHMRDINTWNSSDYRGLGFTKGDRRSSYSVPGNVVSGGKIVALPGCDPANINPVSGRCVLDRFDWTDAIPKNQRDSAYTRGEYQLNGENSFFFEAGITQLTTNLRFDPQFYYDDPSNTFTLSNGNRYLVRLGDLGPRRFDVTDTEVRLIAGFKGIFKGWDYDTAVGYLQSKVRVDARGLVLTDRMEAALANGSYIPGGNNARAVLNSISPSLERQGNDKSTFIDLKISNADLFTLPGGSAGMAAGVEYRRETTSDVDDPNYQAGNVFGFGGLPPLNADPRTAFSVYSELTLPVLKGLEVNAAARADHFSIGGNSVTPKLGLKWNALPTLVVRGTIARGFRAPNFREIAPNVSVGFYNGITDPVRCVTGNEPDCNLSIQGNISGNTNLQPEKSTSNTIGLVWEPIKDWSVSLDYFDIERRNEISQLDLSYLLTQQSDPNFAKFIVRDNTGTITQVNLPYINIGRTEVSGFDLDLKGKKNLGEWGKLNLHATASYNSKYMVTPLPGSPTVDYNRTHDQPAFRGSFALGWEKGPWNHEISMSYVSGFKYIGTPAETCNIAAVYGGPTSYCDIQSTKSWNWFTGYRGFKNLDLTFNVSNLFNTSPPFDAKSALANASFPYDSSYASPLGRRFSVTANYKFQ